MCSLNLKDKKVTVVGLGKSGFAAAQLLYKLGAKVKVTDINNNENLSRNAQELSKLNIEVELGKHSLSMVKGQDLVVVSPGIPDDSDILVFAGENEIPVIGEIELGYRCSEVPIIAVTGTNGKTTVSTMINYFLNKADISSILCGNIGVPFTEVVEKANKGDFIVLEVSSFQLNRISFFKPFIGVLLDIDADHLDMHKDFFSYKSAKYKLFSNQTENDWSVIVDPDYDLVNKNTKTVFFKDNKFLFNNEFYNKSINYENKKILSNENLNSNKKIVLMVLLLLGEDISKYIDSIIDFKNLEHRLEFVAKIKGVSFINDSKSTNISSARWALDRFDNVLLIAGGRNKNLDFNTIPKNLKEKVKHLFVMGEASREIEKAFLSVCPVHCVNNVSQAVKESYKMSNEGDTILFSPMCSSFDMFKNYKERGKIFKQAVAGLKLNLFHEKI